LTGLSYKRHSNDRLELFDFAVEKCLSLTFLNLGIYPDHSGEQPSGEKIDMNIFEPRPDIKTVYAACVLDNDNSIKCLMHKFPKLKYLCVNTKRNIYEKHRYANFAPLPTTKFNVRPDLLTKFITYSTSIPIFHVSTHVKKSMIINVYSKYFKTLPTNSMVPMKLTYPAVRGYYELSRYF
jgi:hypothetical protein